MITKALTETAHPCHILFSARKASGQHLIDKGLLQAEPDQTRQICHFAIGCFVHTKIRKHIAVNLVLRWRVNYSLDHAGGKCHGVSLPLQAGHANHHPTEEHLHSGQSCDRAELTSQPAASKGEFCLSGPCPCFWWRAPASSLVCSLLSLLWAMSRRWMWGFSSCFALSKMHRAVYDPFN